MLPLAYLDIPTRLWLPEELFDALYQSSAHLRDARSATCIDKSMKILLRDDSGVAHKLISYILLAAAHEEPENVYVSIKWKVYLGGLLTAEAFPLQSQMVLRRSARRTRGSIQHTGN
jgi:hypothetical protein